MDAELLASEKTRFAALSPQHAKIILDAAEGQGFTLRSCWYCNGAHEHLKRLDYPFRCFVCGGVYLHGYPAPIVTMRAQDEPITDEVMAQVQEYTRERDDDG